MRRAQQPNGFSLIELSVVLAVISILALTSAPVLTGMLERSRATAALNRLVVAVNHTRHTAVQFNVTTTLCSMKANGRCGADWARDLTVFVDHNHNARIDDGDRIISLIQGIEPSGSVKWRAFQNRQYLQMTPMGYTRFQNGNFVVCPPDGDTRYARQLVVNIQGRVRVNHSVNGAGYPIDRKGKVLRC